MHGSPPRFPLPQPPNPRSCCDIVFLLGGAEEPAALSIPLAGSLLLTARSCWGHLPWSRLLCLLLPVPHGGVLPGLGAPAHRHLTFAIGLSPSSYPHPLCWMLSESLWAHSSQRSPSCAVGLSGLLLAFWPPAEPMEAEPPILALSQQISMLNRNLGQQAGWNLGEATADGNNSQPYMVGVITITGDFSPFSSPHCSAKRVWAPRSAADGF